MSTNTPYRRRLADASIEPLLAELPALFITGPRAAGKTTTAARYAKSVVRLDREAEAVAFRADPDSALRGLPEPVLLDEWQTVPAVLGAVKRAVDDDPRPGRFLITGSVRAELNGELWPGTGRLVRLPMYPMTLREQLRTDSGAALLTRLAASEHLVPAAETPDLRGYVELALRGGFPEPALRLSERARQQWLESYVEHLLTRDAATVSGSRDPVRMRRYAEAYALSTAGVVDDLTLYDAAAVDRKTAMAYERVLGNLFVTETLPAWTSNRLKRLVLRAKRHFVEPALVGTLLRMDVDAVLRDGDLLGRLLDTFVVAQLRPEVALGSARARMYHLRQQQGRYEVDLLAELGGGQIIGIEIKATASPGSDDARHLVWLRDRLGDGFIHGIVLHTGPRVYALGDRMTAAPISVLWS